MGPEERRHDARIKLDHLAYISLQSGNGGIVLDVSENGLGFHAAGPIEAGELIRFRLSVKPFDQIEARGELSWNDERRKRGGLRFIKLPDELQEQIQIWLGQPQLTAGAGRSVPAVKTQFAAASAHPPNPSKISQPSSTSRSGRHVSAQNCAAARLSRVKGANIGLRTALLISLVLVALGLTGTSVFLVPRTVGNYVHEEIVTSTRDTLLTAQASLRQNAATLSRKADLLATYMAMNPTNDIAFQDSTDNSLAAEGSDLVVLADGANQITALHTSNPAVTAAALEPLLLRSVQKGNPSDWWYLGGSLYQVAIEPIDHNPPAQNVSGTVAVGRQTDNATLQGIGLIPGSGIALSYGGQVVASTLSTLDRYELARKLHDQPVAGEIEIGQEPFYSSSVDLPTSSGPVVRLVVVKSYQGETAFLGKLDHLFIRLREVALLILFGLVILVASGSYDRLRPFTHVFARWLGGSLLSVSKWSRERFAHIARGFDRTHASSQIEYRRNTAKIKTP